jgi:hypothetical protein
VIAAAEDLGVPVTAAMERFVVVSDPSHRMQVTE